MTNKSICKQNQETFDKAWDLYWHGIDVNNKSQLDKQWKTMWECVYAACMNHCRKMVRGLVNSKGEPIQVQDLDGKACEASIKIMMKIKEGLKPTLSAYPFLWCYGEIFGVRQQRQDQEADYSYFNNVAYEETEDGYSICTCNF